MEQHVREPNAGVTVSGHGNAVNVGGRGNAAIAASGGGTSEAALATAVAAIRALATEVDDATKMVLEQGAQEIAETGTEDPTRLGSVLRMVRAAIARIGDTLARAVAEKAVSEALKAVGQ
jgi:3-dehydroquinate synthetase